MSASLDGRIHLEPGHRAVGESVAARVKTAAGKREAVKVECSDYDGVRYKVEMPDKDTLCVSLFVRNFDEIKTSVGDKYFSNLYPGLAETPEPGFSLTVKVPLDRLPDGAMDAGAPAAPPTPASRLRARSSSCARSSCRARSPSSGALLLICASCALLLPRLLLVVSQAPVFALPCARPPARPDSQAPGPQTR